MNIPYYLRQRIKHQIINIIMIGFLIATLFPIAWMLYSSIKENTDILAGKVLLSRAHNNVEAINTDNNYIYVCTSDGGINKFEKNSKKLTKSISVQTMTTSYIFDDNFIWASSANRGLLRIDKKDIEKVKEFKLPLKDVDINKVAGTIMAIDKDYIWYSMRYRGFEGIIEFSVPRQVVTRIFELDSKYAPVQIISLIKDKNVLWVGTDKSLLKVDIKSKQILNEYLTQDLLPRGIDIIRLFKENLILASPTGAFLFNPHSGVVVRKYLKSQGFESDQVESILVDGSKIYFGNNLGLSIIDMNTGKITNASNLFNQVDSERNKIIYGKYTSSVVESISKLNGHLLLGSTSGRITQYDPVKNKIISTSGAKKGHLVISWRNYVDLWKNINFGLYLRNSFIICGISSIIAMIFATFSAYAISRYRFPGSRLFSISILATQMIPGIMFLIPIYIMFIKFNEYTGIPLKGTFFGMIFIYSAFFLPMSIWILRGFFAAIPRELEEAARIDGCSPLQIFWHIALPLAIPGIIATGVYIFLTAWDELIFAWILTSADTMTIPVGIRLFVGNYQNRFDLMMAAATVATIPVMIVFFMLQKYIVKGLTAGAVKG